MNKNGIGAIIFDMDGVIVDTEPIHEKIEVEVCREFGINVPKNEWDAFRGKKIEDIFTYISRKYGNGDEPIEKMIERKIKLYLSHALQDVQLVAGVSEFLKQLKAIKKYCYALTTSGRKHPQKKILAKFNLDSYFPIMVTAEDVNNGKPHPEPYVITAQKLSKQPNKCLVIEDSDNGILSAKAAGCQACGITTTFTKEQLENAGADLVISDFAELARILF